MGAAVVPLNIRWAVAEHVYALNDCGARALVVDDAFVDIASEIAKDCPAIEFVMHASDAPKAELISLDALIEGAAPIPDRLFGGEDLAGVFYTGGTTGFPKGVMLPHRGLWSSAISFVDSTRLTPDDRYLHAAPLFHIAGCAAAFNQVMLGGYQTFIPGFEPKAFLQTVEAKKPTASLLVPTMIGMLLQEPTLADADTESLKRLYYGASPITQAILKEAMDKLPSTRFVHLYGQTEMSPMVTSLGPEHHTLDSRKIKSVGRPALSVEVEIVDEDGNEVPRGSVGEVRARGAKTMLGYWNKPEATAEAFIDGWFHTGDVGYLDQDGFLYIVDRIKEIIIRGGENISCLEVEAAIYTHPAVHEAAVFGLPDERLGEIVGAAVVLRDGEEMTDEALSEFLSEHLAAFKIPAHVWFREEQLPRIASGKIFKRQLKADYSAELAGA